MLTSLPLGQLLDARSNCSTSWTRRMGHETTCEAQRAVRSVDWQQAAASRRYGQRRAPSIEVDEVVRSSLSSQHLPP